MDGETFDLQQREDEIIGEPPRVTPLAPGDYPPEAKQIALDIWRASGGKPGDIDEQAPLSDHMATLFRHGELYRAHLQLGRLLFEQGTLAPRDRELAVLRSGWLCRAPFEWGEHVRVAKRIGFSEADIERITEGAAAEGWTAHERAILQAAEQLHRDAMISDETWAVLAQTLNDKQLIELVMVVGHYHMVAFYQNALRVPLNGDNRGLRAR